MSETAGVPQLREYETSATLHAVDTIADDVVLLSLQPTGNAPFPAWTPGAHIDLMLPGNLTRQYSLCGNAAETGSYQVAVLRTPNSRGGSKAAHRLKKGDVVRIRGPRNHFPLASSRNYIFIAGGIGITPLLPMIQDANASRADWSLHYGGRSPTSMAFSDLLHTHGERVNLVAQEHHGLLDLKGILQTPKPETLVYCCGPEPLLAAVEDLCRAWPAGALHIERFVAKEQKHDTQDVAFDVVLQRSGLTLTVEPGVTVFETLRDAGVPVLGSCLEGVCGTCEQKVLGGDVDHRDSVLDDDEQAANDCMMICVSRAKGQQLVLDV